MYFNKQQLEEIKKYLQLDAVKDTSFPNAKLPFNNEEEFALIQSGKNVKTRLVETLDLIAKFKGYYLTEDALKKAYPYSRDGEYCYVGTNFSTATVYKFHEETKGWYDTKEPVLDYIKVWVQGAVSVGPNGNWFNENIDSGIRAQGPIGEAFTYEDFTQEQIDNLQKPALEAAIEVIEKSNIAIANTEEVISRAEDGIILLNQTVLNAVEVTNTSINTLVALQKLGDQVKKDTDIAIERANNGAQYARDQGNYALEQGNTAAHEAQQAVESGLFAEQMGNMADDVAHHPTYIGPDNYVYIYNKHTKTYSKTSIFCKGEPFSIKKYYSTVVDMQADFDNMAVGDMVIINTADPLDLDNSKIYTRTDTEWVYLYQMSKLIGPAGKIPVIIDGVVVKGDDAYANLEPAGFDIDNNPVYKFNAVLPRGDRGAKGVVGPQGVPGDRGIPGINPQRGVDYWTQSDINAMQITNESYINNALGITNQLTLNIISKI